MTKLRKYNFIYCSILLLLGRLEFVQFERQIIVFWRLMLILPVIVLESNDKGTTVQIGYIGYR